MTAGSVFNNISNVKPRGDYAYIESGDYIVHVNEFKAGKNRKGLDIVFFNLKIVSVLDTTDCVKWNQAPHGVGQDVSWLVTLDKDSSLPQMKKALMVLTGVDEAGIDGPTCDAFVSAAQPLRGMFAHYSGKKVKTKKDILITDRRFVRPFSKDQLLSMAEVMANIKALKLSIDQAG